MQKRNVIGLVLAWIMVFSLCMNTYSVFAEGFGNKALPAREEMAKTKAEPQKTRKENKVVENEAIDIGDERTPEAVGAPGELDLSTINTIAKDKDGNCYGVRTYGNNFDTTSFKTFYKITEEQYNQVANDCFMVFKRLDGKPFEIPYARIGTNNITDDQPYGDDVNGPIFSEVQFRHHMAYRLGFMVNSNPTRVDGQEDITWYMKLKKDWVIERSPEFADDSSPDYAYVYMNVVIDGNGHKIYRNDVGERGILQLGSGLYGGDVPVKTATIKNLTIDGAGKYYGIELSQKGILNLQNVKIINGYADTNHSYYGGAIKLNKEAQLTMDADTSITNCKAGMGGAIRLSGNNTVTINGSTFSNNSAEIGGAICSLEENNIINIKNANFEGNKAENIHNGDQFLGGAIYSNSTLNIENTDFKNNTSSGDGGAIVAFADVNLNGATFDGNQSAGNGGAIYQSEGKFNVEETTFSNNRAAKYGGAIYANSELAIEKGKFINNSAKSFGGAIINFKDTAIKNTAFSKNTSGVDGGAIYQSGSSTFALENTSFSENGCNRNGGAIYLNKSVAPKIESTNFNGNESNRTGGAIFIQSNNKNEVEVKGCEFKGNGSNFGGGIYLNTNSKLKLEQSKFVKNQGAFGAGISTAPSESNDAKLTIIDSTFDDNQALSGGGVFTAFPTEIKSSTFTKNEAQVHKSDNQSNPHFSGIGGAVSVMYGVTDIDACTFTENNAYGSGGAININGVNRDEDEDKKITGLKDNVKVNIKGGTVFEKNYVLVGQGGAIHTIPYLYDLGDQTSDVDLKEKAYQNLSTAGDTVFKDNWALSGFVDPPENYRDFTELKFERNSFTDTLKDKPVAKSLLNNYDVNYKNPKISAYFDPNGGEFTDPKMKDPKAVKVITDDKGKEITVPGAPKREGYKFLGWKGTRYIPEDKFKALKQELQEQLKKTEKVYQPGDKFKLDVNFIFVAQWEKDDKPAPKPSKPHAGTFFVKPALNKEDHAQYLIGYENATFKPENNMTREEVAVMFSRLLKNPPTKGEVYGANFSDVEKNRWSATAISYMSEVGILKGYPDGSFKPTAPITRAEFAAMAAGFADLKEGEKTFTDLAPTHWACDVVKKAAATGWINGYPDGSFKADNPITRAEVVSITNRMLDRKADEAFVDSHLSELITFTDVDKSHWAYYPIAEATNGHEFVRDANKIDEVWKSVTHRSFVYDK